QSIIEVSHEVHFDNFAVEVLEQTLSNQAYSKLFLLVDNNTKACCLPVFKQLVDVSIDGVITIEAGEVHKNIQSCEKVWTALSDMGADRKTLLINLGGGVVTDLGGFVAATFKRGIDFINIPTTLLAMVDASVGGKTGVDLGTLKNQVGVILQPKMVLIFPIFLKTLEERQRISGFAEMLKHGLISDSAYWNQLRATAIDTLSPESIQQSVTIKGKIVAKDPKEENIRKKLNFGHTLGHAIESYFLNHPTRSVLLHGEAIAIGMILEGFLSHQLTGLSEIEMEEIKKGFSSYFVPITFTAEEVSDILMLLKHDKKNTHGHINFVLLRQIGQAVVDVQVPDDLFMPAFSYYME
ncbi:MAG: 3-dehydroquinate synthase, partial [Bacteroidota bacterium]